MTPRFRKFLTDAIREWCEADIGMMNAGMVLDSLEAGIVTREDIHRICPHPINPIRVTLTGKQLIETVSRGCEEKWNSYASKALALEAN